MQNRHLIHTESKRKLILFFKKIIIQQLTKLLVRSIKTAKLVK